MKIIKTICVVSIFVLIAVSCRTTEKNYREAYELAKGTGTLQDTLIVNLIAEDQAPVEVEVAGRIMKMRKEYVSIVTDKDVTKDMLKRFNVVVGRFKQLFNARSMATRMSSLGYSSFVVVDRTSSYFVVAAATDMSEEALVMYEKVLSDNRVVYKTPFPWVLEPAQYIRQKPLK